METDHHLSLYTAATEDGLPRPAGMLPRRKNAFFVLREAGRNDSTSVCATPLATVTTRLDMHRASGKAHHPARQPRQQLMNLDGQSGAGRVCCSGSMGRAHSLTGRQPAPS
ncbi:hypothetical protein TcG_13415 [Trypanosoma cruzi]|nr:hypothetical protein TcG_13415 [Trypanosoma cruzi]